MNGEKHTDSAGQALRFPINMPLSVDGVIRVSHAGFVLEINDLDELQQPTIRVIPITHSNADLQEHIKSHVDKAVTVEGHWLRSESDAVETECLRITSLLPSQ